MIPIQQKKKKKKKTSITEYGQAKTTYSYKINVSFCFHGNRKLSGANATFYAQSNTLEHISINEIKHTLLFMIQISQNHILFG